MIDADDVEGLKQVSREVKAAAKLSVAEKPPRRPVCAGLGDGGGAASSSSGAAAADAAPSGALALVPKTRLEERAYTLDEARKLLPELVGCTAAVHPTSGWMVKYHAREPPRSRSRVFEGGDDMGSRMAMCHCISWAWAEHEAQGFDACPFLLI